MKSYFIFMYLISICLGYQLALTQATLYIGKSIAKYKVGTGLQDAITPPWSSVLSLMVYAIVILGIGYGWLKYGWRTGISLIPMMICSTALNMIFLPKKESNHFHQIIIHSTMNRFANFVKHGDTVRARASAEILERLGYPVPEKFQNEMRSHNG